MQEKLIIDLEKKAIKGYCNGYDGFKEQMAKLSEMLKEERPAA